MVLWWPQYSPFLNPIERFWLYFKQLAGTNRLHRSLEELDRSVDEVMAIRIGASTQPSYAFKELSAWGVGGD